ncbi:hypothetical protein Gotur_019839 [Gossypium turneri]
MPKEWGEKTGAVIGFGCMFRELAVFAVLVTIMATSVVAQAKAGCESNCGNISIPYPFGTANGCNISSHFFIRCNTTLNPPKAFLGDGDIEVLDISLDGSLRFSYNYLMGHDCYNSSGRSLYPDFLFSFSEFTISHTRNKFTAIGCDTIAYIEAFFETDSSNRISEKNFSTGCLTFCGDPGDVINGSCSGIFTSISVALGITPTYPENGPGYLCKCNPGFQGNPYLSYGCRDIDECERQKPCYEFGTCHNTPRSCNCSCPEGFEGDGRKNGTGCRPIFKPQDRESFLILVVTLGGLDKAKLFSSKELEIATDQFNENRILGCGGQGMVYKGMLSDGRTVAVKKSKTIDEGYLEQFINEIFILSQIDHRNIIKLLGCCLETEVPLLVYEFIPNGTLSHLIHDQNEEYPRSWDIRLRIVAEVASAISYLHSSTSIPIYHRDIKSSNILLDEKFQAKVSDFGTSRSISIDQTHLTTQVLGTFGYLDPEYFQSSQFTEKSDVYSFGVVIVELLTGKMAISTFGLQEKRGLVSYFMLSMEENHLLDIVDAEIWKDDEKFRAKVSDFGTSRSISIDQTHLTTQVLGTFGYLDPEYFQSNQFTEKSEVYSFGVVIVELLTGKKADDQKDEVVAVAEIAKRCLNLDGRYRPTMKEAAMELERLRSRQGDCIPIDQLKQAEVVVRKSTESWDFTSFSTEHYPNCSMTSTSESDVHPLMLESSLVQDL